MKRILSLIIAFTLSFTSISHASILDTISNAVSSALGVKKEEKKVESKKSEDRIENFIDINLYESFNAEKKEVVKTLVNFENSLYKCDFENLYKYLDINKNDKVYMNLIDFASEDENLKKFVKLTLEDSKFEIITINEMNNDTYQVELLINTFDIEDLYKKVVPKIISSNILGVLTNRFVIDNNFISNVIESTNSVILNENVQKKDDTVKVVLKKSDDKYVFSGVKDFIYNVEGYLKNIISVKNN